YPAVLKKLSQLEEDAGHHKEAIAALEKLNFIYPVQDPDMHRRLGSLLLSQNDVSRAIREFQANLASKPSDLASSYYELAQAYVKANRPDDAREQVISALEAAPGFRPAQKLLLELTPTKKEKR